LMDVPDPIVVRDPYGRICATRHGLTCTSVA
jgi:hypothetical protein